MLKDLVSGKVVRGKMKVRIEIKKTIVTFTAIAVLLTASNAFACCDWERFENKITRKGIYKLCYGNAFEKWVMRLFFR